MLEDDASSIERNTSKPIRSHRDLIVWQKAIELAVTVYSVSESFPRSETYGLTSQIRRAVSSVPANIAEGQGRRLRGEYLNFLGNARGSLWELDTHLELAVRLHYLTPPQHLSLTDRMNEVGRLLNGLIRALK